MLAVLGNRISSTSQTPPRVLLIVAAGSGKTSLLYKLFLGKVVTTTPTHFANTETLTIQGTKFTLWDVGGPWFRRIDLWSHYTDRMVAIIFVVDSTDAFQIEETKTVMWRYFSDFDAQGLEGR